VTEYLGGLGTFSEQTARLPTRTRLPDHKYGRMEVMRTTIDIPDPVYRRLKSRAAREGSSAKALILRGVEQVLKGRPVKAARARRVRLPLVRSKQPGTVRLDNARIYEIISFP
jgi:hypothetical protein